MYSYSQGLQVDFNGTKLGSFSEINFTGAGVTVTNVNGVATVTIPGATRSNVTLGTRNIFVSKQGVDATGTPGDLALDYLTIGAAITAAIALTPSATNPINIVVYTGTYAENITIPAFVNLISAEPLVFLYNASSYSSIASRYSDVKGYVYVNGTITQSGNNVNIVGINCNTLTISVGNSNSSYVGFVASTAILNTSATDSGIWYDVHAESFLANCAINGYHNYCTASSLSFGSSSTANSKNILGKMYNCIVDGVGGYASNTNIPSGFNAGNISGTMDNCVCNGNYSFASAAGGNGGTISGKLTGCTGATTCFASADVGNAGTILGILTNCSGIDICFCADFLVSGQMVGTLINCDAGTNYAFSLSTMYLGGKIIRCRSNPSVANHSAIRILQGTCTFEYCDFKGNGTGFGIASADGANYNIDARFCSFYGTGIHPNLTNLTATPYNTDDVNSIF